MKPWSKTLMFMSLLVGSVLSVMLEPMTNSIPLFTIGFLGLAALVLIRHAKAWRQKEGGKAYIAYDILCIAFPFLTVLTMVLLEAVLAR